jgi:hypothetical protein
MPLVIHPRIRKAIRRIAGLTCLVVLAGAGTALANCPAPAASTPFSQWGDSGSYFLAPGGSFEGTAGQVGWTLSNASLTSGNEPFNVNGGGDQQSLTINAGGSAISPYFCVDNTMSSLRLFARQLGAGNDLRVAALVQTAHGVTPYHLGDLADGSMPSWAPSAPITADTSSLDDGSTLMVALRFRVPPGAGSWQIDDVLVDPYRAGFKPATTTGTDPATTGTDPGTTGTDPGTTGTGSASTGTDPGTTGTGTASTGTDPATTGTDPATTGTDPTPAS